MMIHTIHNSIATTVSNDHCDMQIKICTNEVQGSIGPEFYGPKINTKTVF